MSRLRVKGWRRALACSGVLAGLFVPCVCLAVGGSDYLSAGDVASTIYNNFANIAKLITAGAYIGGLAFAVGAIMKFKQHKDNPTQVPIGTPIAMTMLAACLLFLPSILGVAGVSIFQGGTTATDTGVAWESGNESQR